MSCVVDHFLNTQSATKYSRKTNQVNFIYYYYYYNLKMSFGL